MRIWVLVALLVASCSKRSEQAPASPAPPFVPTVDTMRQGVLTTDGLVRIAAGEARVSTERDWRGKPKKRGPIQLEVFAVVLVEGGKTTAHANPFSFGASICGVDVNVAVMAGLEDGMSAVDVFPGNKAQGWLAFPLQPGCRDLVLNYDGMQHGRARLPLVLTE